MWFVLAIFVVVITCVLVFIKKAFKIHKTGYILITGASSGIGLHAAEWLARRHKFTVLAGVRKEKDAQAIRDLWIPNLEPIIVDVNSHDSIVNCFASISKMMKLSGLPFVALVNNAGVNRHLPIEFSPVEDARDLFNTNFFGVMDMIQMALPLLRESKGRIINVSSLVGFISLPTLGVYSASKFAVEGLSDALRREVAHQGVSVSIVQPAFVKTNMQNTIEPASVEHVKDPEINAALHKHYGHYFGAKGTAKVQRLMDRASSPEVTSLAIEAAITAQYPKTRYPVANSNGVPAAALAWVGWLANDRLTDVLAADLL